MKAGVPTSIVATERLSATEGGPALIEAEAHEMMAQAHLLLARAARLRSEARADEVDDLVPLAETGLDVRTRRRLEKEGRLAVVKLGRRKFTRRSALAALVSDTSRCDVSTRLAVTDPREAARAAYHANGVRLSGDRK